MEHQDRRGTSGYHWSWSSWPLLLFAEDTLSRLCSLLGSVVWPLFCYFGVSAALLEVLWASSHNKADILVQEALDTLKDTHTHVFNGSYVLISKPERMLSSYPSQKRYGLQNQGGGSFLYIVQVEGFPQQLLLTRAQSSKKTLILWLQLVLHDPGKEPLTWTAWKDNRRVCVCVVT